MNSHLAPQPEASDRARNAAQRRADWLISVSEGILDLNDVFSALGDAANRHLSRISLRQLLLSLPEMSTSRADMVIHRMKRALGPQVHAPKKITLSWVFDPRCRGRRSMALSDALYDQRDIAPWVGFPFAPPPKGGDNV